MVGTKNASKKQQCPEIGLTRFYKYSGLIGTMREYLRFVNRIAETQPEDLSPEMLNDLNVLRDEIDLVRDFLYGRLAEE